MFVIVCINISRRSKLKACRIWFHYHNACYYNSMFGAVDSGVIWEAGNQFWGDADAVCVPLHQAQRGLANCAMLIANFASSVQRTEIRQPGTLHNLRWLQIVIITSLRSLHRGWGAKKKSPADKQGWASVDRLLVNSQSFHFPPSYVTVRYNCPVGIRSLKFGFDECSPCNLSSFFPASA